MISRYLKIYMLLLLGAVRAQATNDAHNFEYKNYDWSRNRGVTALSEAQSREPALILKDKRVVEYVYDQGKKLKIYETVHKIIKVNTDDAVQSHNKMYISMSDVISIVELKARSISKSGRVVELDHNNIKELENPDNAGAYKIFAIEGVEVGGEIEYLYTLEQQPRYFGREVFQSLIPAHNIDFEIITPAELIFEAKSYNGFPAMQISQQQYKDKNTLRAVAGHVPALPEEEFSLYNSNLMRVDFKLSYNYEQGKDRILTWDDAANLVYRNVYSFADLDKKQVASVRKYIEQIIPAVVTAEEEKIKLIEAYIKTAIRQQEGNHPVYEDPMKILENKYGNKMGIVKLFALLFTYAGIDHQLALTTDRSQAKFDGNFETWYYLEKYLFYFPKTKTFLAPNHPEYRYSLIPYYYTHNEALFIDTWKIGDQGLASADIRTVPAVSHQRNVDAMEIFIRFNESLEEIRADIKRHFTGYNAIPLRYYYQYSALKEQNLIVERLIRRCAEDAELENVRVNQGLVQTVSPFEQFSVEAEIRSAALIENAGDKHLFKIGELLGPQSQLYHQTERATEAENDYRRSYRRLIEFEIPKGYVVRNLEDLNFEVPLTENNTVIAGFTSQYVLENNRVTVKIEEFYRRVIYPRDQFEGFRKVINAAADFNKVVLVFEKTR